LGDWIVEDARTFSLELRADWKSGPWQHEPDRVLWRTEQAPDLVMLISRGPLGSFNGYVGVPKGHPAFGASYESPDQRLEHMEVHGGVTYTNHGSPFITSTFGLVDDLWWIGFDCGHAGDFTPSIHARARVGNEQYRDLAYVRFEVELLAAQLQIMAERARQTTEGKQNQ
jgi:hypothetical protein